MKKLMFAIAGIASLASIPVAADDPIFYITSAQGGAPGILKIEGNKLTFNRNAWLLDFKPELTCETAPNRIDHMWAFCGPDGGDHKAEFLPDGRMLFNGLVMDKAPPGYDPSDMRE